MCGLNSILLTKSSKTFNVFPRQCLGTEVSIFLPSSPFFSFSYLNAFRYKVPTCNFPFLFYTTFFIHFPLCISFCPTATINFSYTCFNEVGCLSAFVHTKFLIYFRTIRSQNIKFYVYLKKNKSLIGIVNNIY